MGSIQTDPVLTFQLLDLPTSIGRQHPRELIVPQTLGVPIVYSESARRAVVDFPPVLVDDQLGVVSELEDEGVALTVEVTASELNRLVASAVDPSRAPLESLGYVLLSLASH